MQWGLVYPEAFVPSKIVRIGEAFGYLKCVYFCHIYTTLTLLKKNEDTLGFFIEACLSDEIYLRSINIRNYMFYTSIEVKETT